MPHPNGLITREGTRRIHRWGGRGTASSRSCCTGTEGLAAAPRSWLPARSWVTTGGRSGAGGGRKRRRITTVAKSKDKSGGKKEKVLGPATVVRPCLYGALVLTVIQTVMKVFLKA